jgi:YHS domain-containing protein
MPINFEQFPCRGLYGARGMKKAQAAGEPRSGTARMRRRRGRDARAFIVMLGLLAGPAGAASGHVVTDRTSGIAIEGFDPVSYFVDGRPRRGSPRFEATWQGVTWRFVNEGNREAFRAHPELYAPRLGGHAVVPVARGDTAEGDPTLWTIHNGRLYFFYGSGDFHAFRFDPEGFARRAELNWPRLDRELPR